MLSRHDGTDGSDVSLYAPMALIIIMGAYDREQIYTIPRADEIP